ncbi:MAG TPA: hypothetical protein VMT00_15690 [Thermoanaerobaculia bacterium]|nr:hypothetical protein [Thermoanaerobaculia bacterium]
MNRKSSLFDRVCSSVIVGVVREETAEDGLAVARTYARHGLDVIEITFTTPAAESIIRTLREESDGRITIAAGSLRNGNDAAAARRAGAEILVSPHTDLRVIEYGTENQLLVIAGAATPTEIIQAWERGADLIKVYPAAHLGGPDYIRTIRQPIRDVPLLAGGPVPLELIEAYLEAGVLAVNLGGSLAVPDLVRQKKWDAIGKRVEQAIATVRSLRSELPMADSMVH